MNIEVWKPVVGFDAYEVSSLGRARRTKAARGTRIGKFLKASPGLHGYPMVAFSMHGIVTQRTLHSIVCEAFHGKKPSSGHEVAHLDGVRTNCCERNLQWKTISQNNLDKNAHGTMARGECFSHSVLSEKDVLRIIEIRKTPPEGSGPLGCRRIAAIIGKPRGAVSQVIQGNSWTYITGGQL